MITTAGPWIVVAAVLAAVLAAVVTALAATWRRRASDRAFDLEAAM